MTKQVYVDTNGTHPGGNRTSQEHADHWRNIAQHAATDNAREIADELARQWQLRADAEQAQHNERS